MKKRIFAILAAAIIVVMLIVPSFATEYGEEPYEVISSWTEYEANERPNPVEQKNPYTLVINVTQTGDIDWMFTIYQTDSQNNPVSYDIHIEYGTVWINEGQADEETVNTGIMLIPFYWIDTSPYDIFNDTSEGYILNNQQLVTMQNYTYTDAEVEALETDAYQSGVQAGLTTGRQEGYTLGYNAGYAQANEDQNIADAGIRAITAAVEAPFNVVSQWLNFEVLGVNLLQLLISLFAVCIIVIVIKAIIK